MRRGVGGAMFKKQEKRGSSSLSLILLVAAWLFVFILTAYFVDDVDAQFEDVENVDQADGVANAEDLTLLTSESQKDGGGQWKKKDIDEAKRLKKEMKQQKKLRKEAKAMLKKELKMKKELEKFKDTLLPATSMEPHTEMQVEQVSDHKRAANARAK